MPVMILAMLVCLLQRSGLIRKDFQVQVWHIVEDSFRQNPTRRKDSLLWRRTVVRTDP